MAKRNEELPDVDDLLAAVDAHATAAGDHDYAVGDPQEILRAARRIMTPGQFAVILREPELIALADLPEYEPLIGRLVHRA